MTQNNEEMFGIYKAIVTDISCFNTTGKIKTRISAFNFGSSPSNILDGYDSSIFAKSISKDVYTDIMLPFGGGNDYGMFKIPQVNSVGLVAFINGSSKNPVWIGSTANSIFDRGQLVELDYPSDNIDSEKGAIYFDENNEETVFNMSDMNSFILKTKTNELHDFTNPDTIDWKKNPIENAIILNSAKAIIHHRINDVAKQEIILGNEENGTGKLDIGYTISDNNYKRVTFNENTITIKNKSGDDEASIYLEDDGSIYISASENNDGNNSTGSRIDASIRITPASINIKAGHSRITMSRVIDENQEVITINASKLKINAKDIAFGSTGHSLVVSPNPGLNFTLEDGSLLTTATNIRV